MPFSDPPRTPSATPRRLLRCDRCVGSVVCTPEQLMRFTRDGWPRCCGDVMALFTEASPPAIDDTSVDRPSLPRE